MADNKEQDEEQPMTFIIPNNFTDSGKVLQGMIDTRNAVEAVVIVVGLGWLEKNILFSLVDKKVAILIMMVTLAPLLVISIMGINGDSFTVFIKTLFAFLRNKRKLRFRRIYTHGQEELLKSANKRGRNTSKKTATKSKTRKK